MIFKHLLLITALAFSTTTTASEPSVTEKGHKKAHEKAITFSTMDGKTTDAFEGAIEVPENRLNPDSRKIPLKYVRFPATGKNPGSPIIYLSGGPGGSGISTAKYPHFRFPLFMALRDHGDVIALDQRGTGISDITPKCISSQVLPRTEALKDEQVTALYKTAAQECMTFWKKEGVDVFGYTTTQNALDLDDLRQHLGAEKVTLWGISYGSHLALSSLKIMQGRIDKVVIASVEGLNQTVKLPARTDAYFARLQQAINTQPKAAKAYPDLKALMHRVHKKLDTNPIAVKIPQKEGSQLDLLFQRQHLQRVISGMITDPGRGAKHIPELYLALDQGNTNALMPILKRGYFDDNRISFSVMSFAMDIASGITNERLELVKKQAKTSLLGDSLNFPMPQLNRAIKALDLGDDFRAEVQSDVPTLLLTGTLDGRTYIKSQQEATQGLSNLTQIMITNGGHNLFMSSPKVTEAIKSFLSNEKIKVTEITVELPDFSI
jgi:pimeloyl-ACP methyl ester carboxylesterase